MYEIYAKELIRDDIEKTPAVMLFNEHLFQRFDNFLLKTTNSSSPMWYRQGNIFSECQQCSKAYHHLSGVHPFLPPAHMIGVFLVHVPEGAQSCPTMIVKVSHWIPLTVWSFA